MLPLKERRPDGSIVQTVGTMTIISPDGIGVTALHCVLWDGSLLYPEALWVHTDACKLTHVASFPSIDVSVWRLSFNGSSPHASLGGSIEAESACSSGSGGDSGNSRGVVWPHVPPFPQALLRLQQGKHLRF